MDAKNLIGGRRAVLEALLSNMAIDEILIVKDHAGGTVAEIQKEAQLRSVTVRQVSPGTLNDLLPGHNHQGVIARTAYSEFVYASEEDLFEIAAERKEKLLVAILDEITDPHNLGAIIRSAEGAGFHGVIIPKHRSAEINATVMKTSAGAVSHIRITQVTNLSQAIESLKEQNVWIYGTTGDAEKDYAAIDAHDAVGIVIGSEGKGLRKLIAEHCDFLVKIPMYGKLNSLNASVAAGIVFFDVARRRRNKKTPSV